MSENDSDRSPDDSNKAPSYAAWNGDRYPWPPPDGWELKSDGRYWPADQGPPAPAPFVPLPPPPSFVPPAPSVYMPPPGAMPPPGVMPPSMIGPPKGNNNKTYIVLAVVLGLIVLSVASCVAVVISAGDQFVDAFESVADETQAAVDAIEFDMCGIDDGELTLAGTITNPRDIVSSFRFTVVIFDASGAQITQTEIVVPDLAPGETAPFSARLTETISSDRFACEVSTMVIEPFRFGN